MTASPALLPSSAALRARSSLLSAMALMTCRLSAILSVSVASLLIRSDETRLVSCEASAFSVTVCTAVITSWPEVKTVAIVALSPPPRWPAWWPMLVLVGARRDLVGRGVEPRGGAGDLDQDLLEIAPHEIGALGQLRQLVLRGQRGNLRRKVPVGKASHSGRHRREAPVIVRMSANDSKTRAKRHTMVMMIFAMMLVMVALRAVLKPS